MIFKGDARPSEDCRNAVHRKPADPHPEPAGHLGSQLPGRPVQPAGRRSPRGGGLPVPQELGAVHPGYPAVDGLVHRPGHRRVPHRATWTPRPRCVTSTASCWCRCFDDVGFLKKLELELGGRYSDYEDTDSTFTWKATANLEITDWIRLRGGYNLATRAPNLGELFLSTAGDLHHRRQLRRSLQPAVECAVRRWRCGTRSGHAARRAPHPAGCRPDCRGSPEHLPDLPGPDDPDGRSTPSTARTAMLHLRPRAVDSRGSSSRATRTWNRKRRTPGRPAWSSRHRSRIRGLPACR